MNLDLHKSKNSRGTKTRQGVKKKKRSPNLVNIQSYEPDFRDMPIPERIDHNIQYQPLDRDGIVRNRHLERAKTFSNLPNVSTKAYHNSESSFSLYPADEKNESVDITNQQRQFSVHNIVNNANKVKSRLEYQAV